MALDAVAILRDRGVQVQLDICGTAFAGYEYYVDELRARSEEPDLAGSVRLLGYVSPIWSALADVDAMLAPSLREPFGNAVVEAQLAMRPVIASAALGHLETITDGVTGLLVPPNDPSALAAALSRLIADPTLASDLTVAGRQSALDNFSVDRYQSEVVRLVSETADRRRGRH